MNSLYNFKAFFIAFWIINRTSATKSMKTKKKALKLSKIISSFEVPGSWIRFFFGQKRDPIPAFQAMRVYYNAMLTTGEGAFSKVYLAESIQDKGGLAAVKVRILHIFWHLWSESRLRICSEYSISSPKFLYNLWSSKFWVQ